MKTLAINALDTGTIINFFSPVLKRLLKFANLSITDLKSFIFIKLLTLYKPVIPYLQQKPRENFSPTKKKIPGNVVTAKHKYRTYVQVF